MLIQSIRNKYGHRKLRAYNQASNESIKQEKHERKIQVPQMVKEKSDIGYKCFNCGEKGHLRKDCPKKTVAAIAAAIELEDIPVDPVQTPIKSFRVLADTGSDFHVFGADLIPYVDVKNVIRTIKQPFGSSKKVRGEGKVRCLIKDTEGKH